MTLQMRVRSASLHLRSPLSRGESLALTDCTGYWAVMSGLTKHAGRPTMLCLRTFAQKGRACPAHKQACMEQQSALSISPAPIPVPKPCHGH